MNSLDDIVGFKNRKIYQNRDFFCFSLDSLLLAYYTEIKKNDERILELGVGNGVNLLILSKKHKQKMIGIDIQKESVDLAKKSIKYNKLEEQIEIKEMDIKGCYKKLGNDCFDVILCNPPYFSKESITKNKVKTNAKSEQLLSLDDVFRESSKLLKNGGRLYMVYPVTNLEEVLESSRKYNLGVKNIRYVYYNKERSAKIMLFKACKNAKKGLIVEKPLILFENGGKTPEYRKIMGEEDD